MTTAPGTTEKLYTVEEWLEFEKTAEIRHEYYFGKPSISPSRTT